jgi:hypothetical protein
MATKGDLVWTVNVLALHSLSVLTFQSARDVLLQTQSEAM